jgi:hypothetical protein
MGRLYTMTILDKQQQTRRLKPLKSTLNPTLYQFILWVTNQRWGYNYSARRGRHYKLWK